MANYEIVEVIGMRDDGSWEITADEIIEEKVANFGEVPYWEGTENKAGDEDECRELEYRNKVRASKTPEKRRRGRLPTSQYMEKKGFGKSMWMEFFIHMKFMFSMDIKKCMTRRFIDM